MTWWTCFRTRLATDSAPEFALDSSPPRVTDRYARRVSSALTIIAVLGLGGILYAASAALIPVALAILIAMVLSTPVEALYRRGLPRSASAVFILLASIGLAGGAINLVWAPGVEWWKGAPHTLRIIERKMRPVTELVDRITVLSDRAGRIASVQTGPAPPAPAPVAAVALPVPVVATPRENVAVAILDSTRTVLVTVVTVVVVSLFLMAGGPPMLARMSAALAHSLRAGEILTRIEAVRVEIARYYLSIALINLGLGAATACAMLLLGMPNPLLWGVVAALLNFIPYLGSATTLVLLSIAAFVSFDKLIQVLLVGGSFLLLATVEGQLVQPWVVGRRLQLNPLLVFLAVWFGGWFWGLAGIVLAVPTLVIVKIIAEHSPHGKPLEEFLGRGARLARPGRTRLPNVTNPGRPEEKAAS